MPADASPVRHAGASNGDLGHPGEWNEIWCGEGTDIVPAVWILSMPERTLLPSGRC